MPGVTISAGYGAGGSIIAPEVARRLGLPLIDRAISSRVAAQLQVSVQEAEGGEVRRPLVDRFLAVLAPLAGGVLCAGTDAAPPEALPPPDDAALFREQAEAIMTAALQDGAVILGRAGAAAFHQRPDVLCVRLFGPPDARIAQAARIEHVDQSTARQRLPGGGPRPRAVRPPALRHRHRRPWPVPAADRQHGPAAGCLRQPHRDRLHGIHPPLSQPTVDRAGGLLAVSARLARHGRRKLPS